MEGGRFPLRMALALWLAGVATPATTPTERMLVALGTQQPPQPPFGTEAVAGFELRPASLAETVHAVVLAISSSRRNCRRCGPCSGRSLPASDRKKSS